MYASCQWKRIPTIIVFRVDVSFVNMAAWMSFQRIRLRKQDSTLRGSHPNPNTPGDAEIRVGMEGRHSLSSTPHAARLPAHSQQLGILSLLQLY